MVRLGPTFSTLIAYMCCSRKCRRTFRRVEELDEDEALHVPLTSTALHYKNSQRTHTGHKRKRAILEEAEDDPRCFRRVRIHCYAGALTSCTCCEVRSIVCDELLPEW